MMSLKTYLEIFKIFFFSITLCSNQSINRTDKFPIYSNSSFNILFKPVKTYSPFSLIKLQIVCQFEIEETVFINPGIENNLKNKISNKYMSVINWHKNTYRAIEMIIQFHPSANRLIFEILYYNGTGNRYNAFRNRSVMNRIFSEQIQLNIDAILDFYIATRDGRTDGVNSEEMAVISCESKNGVPPGRPILKYIDQLDVKNRKFHEADNRIVVHAFLRKSDHNKYVKCMSTGVTEYRYIKIFHHPTALQLRPNYAGTMPNGSSVLCTAADGYPPPTINWEFISGPPNASQFYSITAGNNLTILPHCPLHTQWTFNCTALNSIPKSYDLGTTRSFTFTVSQDMNVISFLFSGIVIKCFASFFGLLIIICIAMKRKSGIKGELKFSSTLSQSKKRMTVAKEKWIKKINFIDEMRSKFSADVNEALKLPQIIVVGDQSSGKSSILQAISGIKLPRGVNTVTRCPVVMQMRKSTETRIQIKYRSEPFKDISDTESEIMKIQTNVFNNTITKEPITISIQSPESVTLTIIDLPGLVKTNVQGQSRHIIQKTHEIARDFMIQENSLIICVLPANQDICTTTTIREAIQCNPDKSRIIGVLTKLDKLDKKEATLIPDIIRNYKLPIKKGYYGLIVSDEILELTNKDEIAKVEKNILKRKKLWTLDNIKRLGLSNFTDALVEELGSLINKTLPILRENVDKLLTKTNGKLEKFSKYHGGEEIQKKYMSEKIKEIKKKTKYFFLNGKHEIQNYTKIKNYLEKKRILSSIQEHETFIYLWDTVFSNLFKEFFSIYQELFADYSGKYHSDQYLEDINKKNRTENIQVFISSTLFKTIVDKALLNFKKKVDECVKVCCHIISFIIEEILIMDIEDKLSPLKMDIQKISRRVLSEKKLEIEKYLTFLFKSEHTYFTQAIVIDAGVVPQLQPALVTGQNAPQPTENLQTRNGRILKDCLKNYLINTIHKLGNLIPSSMIQSLFIDFSKSLIEALETEILYSKKSLSYISLTDQEKEEIEELRKTKILLEEYSSKIRYFYF